MENCVNRTSNIVSFEHVCIRTSIPIGRCAKELPLATMPIPQPTKRKWAPAESAPASTCKLPRTRINDVKHKWKWSSFKSQAARRGMVQGLTFQEYRPVGRWGCRAVVAPLQKHGFRRILCERDSLVRVNPGNGNAHRCVVPSASSISTKRMEFKWHGHRSGQHPTKVKFRRASILSAQIP